MEVENQKTLLLYHYILSTTVKDFYHRIRRQYELSRDRYLTLNHVILCQQIGYGKAVFGADLLSKGWGSDLTRLKLLRIIIGVPLHKSLL
ncbi:MAG: hypothetical protein DCF22_24420 [Leptolyngbya sp.]|nr:MAG: hypothetical protein DCF22_24420 [Leptolyngbya sp.]